MNEKKKGKPTDVMRLSGKMMSVDVSDSMKDNTQEKMENKTTQNTTDCEICDSCGRLTEDPYYEEGSETPFCPDCYQTCYALCETCGIETGLTGDDIQFCDSESCIKEVD